MGDKKKQYAWRGLDLRTNILYRQDGTASDVRNLTLTPSRELRKRVDMVTTIVPRAAEGIVGEFLNELPFDAVIIDIVDYEDHKVIATKIRKVYDINGNDRYIDINKFYKWFEDTNTVEFIPLEQRTTDDPNYGQVKDRVISNIDGRFQAENQENVLFFSGDFTDTDMTNTADEVVAQFFYFKSDQESNLSYMYTYDGKVICVAGCPSLVEDTTDLSTITTTEEYVRILPFKIDAKDRHTFGNYSTHLSTYGFGGGLYQTLDIPASAISTTSEDYQAYCKCNTNRTIDITDDVATRTIDIEYYESAGTGAIGVSVAKGQYLYSVEKTEVRSPFSPPYTTGRTSFDIYRMDVEDIDYIGNTITVNNFKQYSSATGKFEDSTSIKVNSGSILSNILVALYGSADATFGFEFRSVSTMGYIAGSDFSDFYFTKEGSSTFTELFFDPEFLFLNTKFSDTYAEETVKLPAPKVRSFTKYVGAFAAVDDKAFYFSDISLGGNIETYTPFDTFPVGSSEFGPITGVFGNQTFLAVFRQEESYYISGNIFTANYRIQSYKSTRIGCSDPRSIIDYRGAGVFASEKGLFVCAQGGAMYELSDIIEPLFSNDVLGLSLDQFDVKGAVDFIGERLLFAFESATESFLLEYNYYHKEWLLHDGIPMTGGMLISDRKLYSSDGTNVLIEGDTYTESDAYYKSNYETLGAPSILKKIVRLKLFTVSMPSDFTVNIEAYSDWQSEELQTEQSKDGLAGQVDLEQRLDSSRVKSLAMKIGSPSGSPFISAGYEYEYGEFSRDYQNDD